MTQPGRISPRSAGAPDSTDPEVWAPRLTRILDGQRALYENLARLSIEQSRRIDDDDTDGLLDVLGRRQEVIERLALTNEEVAPYRAAWDRLAPALPTRHRDALRERFDAVAGIVDQIAARDEADRVRLEARRSAIGGELRSLARGRGAVSAYARGPSTGPRYQDRHG